MVGTDVVALFVVVGMFEQLPKAAQLGELLGTRTSLNEDSQIGSAGGEIFAYRFSGPAATLNRRELLRHRINSAKTNHLASRTLRRISDGQFRTSQGL
jgi:hypothetical protein